MSTTQPFVFALLLATFSTLAAQAAESGSPAGAHGHGAHDQARPEKKGLPGQVHKAKGWVRKVDFVMDELTIVHEPVESLSWPVMKMEFKVKDRKMLDQVRPSLKVEFSFIEAGKDYVITQIRETR